MSGGSGAVVVFAGGDAFDDFNRVETSGLGFSTPTGYAWEWDISGSPFAIPTVNGAEAVCPYTPGFKAMRAYFDVATNGVPAEMKLNKFVFTTRFRQSGIVSSGFDYVRFVWNDSTYDTAIHLDVELRPDGPLLTLQLKPSGNNGTAVISAAVPDEWYILKLDFEAGSHGRAKFWKESDGEPASWMIDLPDTITDISGSVFWDWTSQLGLDHTFSRTFDYISFGGDAAPVLIYGR